MYGLDGSGITVNFMILMVDSGYVGEYLCLQPLDTIIFGSDGMSWWQCTLFGSRKRNSFSFAYNKEKVNLKNKSQKDQKPGYFQELRQRFHQGPCCWMHTRQPRLYLFISVKRINQKQQLHLESLFDYNPLSFSTTFAMVKLSNGMYRVPPCFYV